MVGQNFEEVYILEGKDFGRSNILESQKNMEVKIALVDDNFIGVKFLGWSNGSNGGQMGAMFLGVKIFEGSLDRKISA